MNIPILTLDRAFELTDDFYFLDTTKWNSVDDAGTGTNTANDTPGGEVSIVTAGADNDYHLMKSAKQVFKFVANKPAWFEARFSLTEANTSAANIILGMTSVTTSGNLQNDGAGPASSHSGALIYKVDGTMTLKGHVSNATTQANLDLLTFVSGTVYRAGFHFAPQDSTKGRVHFWVYDESSGVLTNSAGKNAFDLSLPISLSGLAAMNVVYGVKAGSSSAETLKLDYVRAYQAR